MGSKPLSEDDRRTYLYSKCNAQRFHSSPPGAATRTHLLRNRSLYLYQILHLRGFLPWRETEFQSDAINKFARHVEDKYPDVEIFRHLCIGIFGEWYTEAEGH